MGRIRAIDYRYRKLAGQLQKVGKELLQPPTQVNELLSLLDKVGSLLREVEQNYTKLIQNAYSQWMEALLAEPLFRNTDADVRVAVASCISEFVRITAPEAPYSDSQMKEVFQLIVSSFENLSDMSSRSYDKRASILEVAARVRSGVLMLDLECDCLISEMFKHFLSSIRDFHPENIFVYMESIMTAILEESYEVLPEHLIPILATLKRNNEEISTSARKLGESVLANCAVKLQPYLKEAVKVLGLPLDDYSEIVATICNKSNGEVEQNSDNASLQEEKPEAAEVASKPSGRDDEIVTIDKNDRAAEASCIRNSGQISEKSEAAELVSKPFGHDNEIVAIDKNDRAVDDFPVLNFAHISEKQEAAGSVSKLFGYEIVAIDKNDRAADEFQVVNFGQIFEKPEAAELWSKLFGHDDKIVAIDKNGQPADESTIPVPKQKLFWPKADSLVDTALASATKSGSQSQTTTSKREIRSKSDDEQSSKLEETIGILAGAADETAMSASKRRRDLTTEDFQTQLDNTASSDNASASGTKFRSQSQTTTSKKATKSKNDNEQTSKLEEIMGILARASDELATSALKRRRYLTTKDVQTAIDNAALVDNAPAPGTKSQSQSKTTTSKRTIKSKNDDISLKLTETIGILAEALKDMVDNKKLPIPVDELWGFIHEMKLDEDLAGDAFVFLLERPVQLKGLISTPTGVRKSILLKMMMRGAK